MVEKREKRGQLSSRRTINARNEQPKRYIKVMVMVASVRWPECKTRLQAW